MPNPAAQINTKVQQNLAMIQICLELNLEFWLFWSCLKSALSTKELMNPSPGSWFCGLHPESNICKERAWEWGNQNKQVNMNVLNFRRNWQEKLFNVDVNVDLYLFYFSSNTWHYGTQFLNVKMQVRFLYPQNIMGNKEVHFLS